MTQHRILKIRNTAPESLLLVIGFALLIFVVAFPAIASQPTHSQMTISGQSEEEPKKKGETEEETPASTTEEDDDEPDC